MQSFLLGFREIDACDDISGRSNRTIVLHGDDTDRRSSNFISPTQYCLIELDKRTSRSGNIGLDLQEVVHQGGSQIIDLQSTNSEKQTSLSRQ